MNKLKILLVSSLLIFCLLVLVKIGMFQLCNFLDKGFTNHSSSLFESRSKGFLLESFIVSEISENDEFESNKEFKLSTLFLENSWDNTCTLLGTKKTPEKVKGYNIVLPVKFDKLESIDKFTFYLAFEKDTIVLRGNKALETVYRNKSWAFYSQLSNSALLIKDKAGIMVYQYTLTEVESHY